MNHYNLKLVKHHPRLICPECNVSMTPFSCQDVIIDKCESCGGIWFDKKELGIFRDSLKALPIETIEVHKTPPSDEYVICFCPRCKSILNEEKQSYNSTVNVNKCIRCEGLWIPHAELLKFIDLARIAKITEPEVAGIAAEVSKSVQKERRESKVATQIRNPGLILFFRIIPLYDDNPRDNKPWVTVVLMLFCFTMFLVTMPIEKFLDLGLVPGHLKYSTLITSLFLHVNVFHLIGNLFYLWTFGDNIEDVIGPWKYIVFFLLCGIFAGGVHIVLNPNSLISVIGASGAISGLMGGYFYLFPHIKLKTWVCGVVIDVPIWLYLGLWFILQLVNTIVTASFHENKSGVAFGVHVGGFIVGYIVFWMMSKKIKSSREY